MYLIWVQAYHLITELPHLLHLKMCYYTMLDSATHTHV